MAWPTAEEQDDSQEEQRDDGDDLDACEYEFGFAVSLDNYTYVDAIIRVDE